MRIFVNNVDSYVGKALCADLRGALGQETRLIGTVAGEVDQELMKVMGVRRVVSRADHKKYLADVLSCSLIVYDLHSADIEDVEQTIKHLKLATLSHDTTFVLVSSVNVWARTKQEYVPLNGDDEDEADPADDDGDGALREVRKRPKELTDADLDRRVPSPAFESWKYLETLTLSLASKERLRPHVVAAGILYGNGETTFNELFKAAWLTQPTHRIIMPGDNYIPCVHVRDVARLVKMVHVRDPKSTPPIGRYLIAVDKARLTQADIVQSIVNHILGKFEVPVMAAEDVSFEFKEVMMLDLILEPSAPMKSSTFPWWSRDGLVKNIEQVAAEFCKWRNLRPMKMLVLAPPGSGAERLCASVAERYLHKDPPHLTFDQILEDAMSLGTPAARRLRARVARLAQKPPGAKLPLKIRTALVRKRLRSNVCRFRGYVLEGYPGTYEEAEALFTERVLAEGEEPEPEEDDEAQEDEPPADGEPEPDEEDPPPAPPADEEDEEEGGERPKRRVRAEIVPEFVVSASSAPSACKARIFQGLARGPGTEQEFLLRTEEYRKANFTQDGSPGTTDFFSEVVGSKVLRLDLDSITEEEAFQSVRVYMESKGPFFNYLKSSEARCREALAQVAAQERQAEEDRLAKEAERAEVEAALRMNTAEEEAIRRQVIADSEAHLLERETMPLRQYLMIHVVPTLSEGLSDLCKAQPEDPFEYLAQYLFAHAQDINRSLEARASS